MKSYGHINFNDNQAQQMALQVESNFPDIPVVGRIVFKDKRVFICTEIIGGVPAWVPLTNEIDTHVHRVPAANGAQTWTVTHNLNTPYPLVQVYDLNHSMLIPNAVEAIDNNTTNISFSYPQAGTAVLMHGNDSLGVTRYNSAVEILQSSLSSQWVLDHDLGYYPIVRIFIGNAEVQPDSIIHTSVFQTVVTFSTPQLGVARLV